MFRQMWRKSYYLHKVIRQHTGVHVPKRLIIDILDGIAISGQRVSYSFLPRYGTAV